MKRFVAGTCLALVLALSPVPAQATSCAMFDPDSHDHVFVGTAGPREDGRSMFTISEIWVGDPLPAKVFVTLSVMGTEEPPMVGADYLIGTDSTLTSSWCSQMPADDARVAGLRPAAVQEPLDPPIVETTVIDEPSGDDIEAAPSTNGAARWVLMGVGAALVVAAGGAVAVRRSRARA